MRICVCLTLCLICVSGTWTRASGYSGEQVRNDRISQIDRELKRIDNVIRSKSYTLVPVVEALRQEATALGDPGIMVMSNLVLAKGYESQKDYDRTYACVDRAFAIADSADFHGMDYMLNYRKGFILTLQGENEASIEYLQKAVEIAKGKGHESAHGQALAHIGYAYAKTGDFVQSIEHLDAASEILHRIGDEFGLQTLYTHMAVYYSRRGDREKALEQQKKALETSIARKDTTWIISSHVNLLSSYALLGDIENATYHYQERNRLIDLIEYPEDRKLDLNIGVLYVQSGQYAKALEILELCQQYYIKEGNTYRVALIDHWKALAYRGLDRYDLAAEKSIAAFDGARENDNKKLAELSAYTLFQTYHWRGRDGEAIKWLVTSNEIKDSIQSEEKEKEMLALETKYQTFRKEQEIEMLKAKSETERVKRNQLLIGLISSLLIGGMLVYHQIIRRRADKVIQAQQLDNARLEQEKLKERLHHKEKELATQLLNMAQKNEFLIGISSEIKEIREHATDSNRSKLQKVIRTIAHDLDSNESWEQLLASFKEIHHTYVEKLVNTYKLTANEVRLALMMKMNISSKEIASLLNISDPGVKKARYRLRKKLGVDSEVNIQEFLLGLG